MNKAMKTVFFAAVFAFAAGAFAQTDTASVPFIVNVAAEIRVECTNVKVATTGSSANRATVKVPVSSEFTSVSYRGAQGLNAPVITNSNGKVTLNLPAQSYKSAEISLHSVNGRRVVNGRADGSGAVKSISRQNVAPGLYLLSVKGTDGSAFTTRLTHRGGKLSVNAVIGTAPMLNKSAAVGDPCTITIMPVEAGYAATSITIAPEKAGLNDTVKITLQAETGGYAPDMLGLMPGTTIASVNLNWISTNTAATAGDKALVRLYSADGALVKTDTGKAANATTGKRHHKATLTGLAPNTNYKYAVSSNGTDWSYKYNYKTPPAGNVFTIAVIADPQITDGDQDSNTKPKATPPTVAQGWKETVEKIALTNATFIVSAGDQVDDASNYKESQYQKFFAPNALRSLPLAPIVGNHDLHAQFHNHFNMPNMTDNPGSSYSSPVYSGGGNYYYLYNNILFVALNTGSYPNSLKDAQGYVAKYQKAMDAAKAAHAGAYDWLIVQHHKSTTSISSHACDKELEYYIEAGLEKLITDSGVDVVITGHDHIHVRSHLMKWDAAKGYSVKSTDGKGAIYLTLSTASAVKFYPALFILEPGSNEYVSEYTEKFPVLSDGTRGFTEFYKVRSSMPFGTVNANKIPLSVDFYVKGTSTYDYTPNYTPNYTIFEVNGKTIKATTYATADNKVVDEFTLTPKGSR